MTLTFLNKIGTVLLLSLILLATEAHAINQLPGHLIPFDSQDSLKFLKRDLNSNTLNLLGHFTTQQTVTYCGIASTVMILNAQHLVAPVDARYVPYHYFTQDNFFTEQVSQITPAEEVRDHGIALSKLDQMIQTFGLKTKLFYANDVTIETFRTKLQHAILKNKFIIVNFSRTALQETGGGHYSPIGTYDKASDRVLLLDVSRYKYPAYWVKTIDLWQAIHTQDSNGVYRGFIIITQKV
ncbi:MAG: phytochelatin synthase family protein [Gammaproteobacteria bacterium]|nr:phytochelatin synthase family protein [Gammaproteobacteria bacterium]